MDNYCHRLGVASYGMMEWSQETGTRKGGGVASYDDGHGVFLLNDGWMDIKGGRGFTTRLRKTTAFAAVDGRGFRLWNEPWALSPTHPHPWRSCLCLLIYLFSLCFNFLASRVLSFLHCFA